MLSISDMKDDAKVLAHLDDVLFIDSSVTLSEEEYLKNAIKAKLVYEGCISNKLFIVNDDVSALEQAQMTYLFSRDTNFTRILLNLSLTNSPITVEKMEDSEKKLTKELEQQGDLTSLIELTKKAAGSYRIIYNPQDPQDPTAYPADFSIELPVTINPSTLDWSALEERDVMNLLENCLNYAAGVSQTLHIKPEMFSQEIQNFVLDLPRIADVGYNHARGSTLNSVSFQSIKDPFKTLFDGILNV